MCGALRAGRPIFLGSANEAEPSEGDLKQRLSKLLGGMEEGIKDAAKKATIADFIRLTQFIRELEKDEPPREVIITWIERVEKSDIGT